MRVSFETSVFDPQGAVSLEALPDSSLDTHTRRVTRTATLDGHSVIIDHGYTAADATLAIRAVLDPATAAALLRLMRIYPQLVCSTPGGCFLGVIDDLRQDRSGQTALQFLVQRALALTADL